MSHRYTMILVFCLPCVLFFGFVPASQADDYTRRWVVGTGDWSNPTHWDEGEPTSSLNANISNGGTATITLSGERCKILALGLVGDGSGSVEITSGYLTSERQYVGSSDVGSITQSGGTNYSDDIYVGYSSLGSGTYTLSGTGELRPDYHLYVGNSGTGYFTQTGGELYIAANSTNQPGLYLGYNSDASGTYNQNDGTIIIPRLHIGCSGTGTFSQSGGNNQIRSVVLGDESGSNGMYTLSGSGQLSPTYEYVGLSGTGVFTQSGGNHIIDREFTIGHHDGSMGTYTLSGTGQLQASSVKVGGYGTGDFIQSGGTTNIGTVYLGTWLGGDGTYTLSDGLLYLSWQLTVGAGGTGEFTQTGGTTNIDSSRGLYFCTNSGTSGTYNLNGGTLIVSKITIGSGTAAFNFGGGTLKASGALNTTLPMTLTGIDGDANVNTNGHAVVLAGQLSGPGGLNKLGDGTLTLSGNNSYAGKTVINAGALVIDGESRLGNNPASFTADQLTLDGGTLQTTDTFAIDDDNRGVTLKSGGGTFSQDSDTALTVSNAIAGNGGLTKIGDGTLVLSGANNYTGKTVINAGTLVIGSEGRLGNNPASFTADQLTLDGGTLQTTATFAIDDGNRGVTLEGGGGTFSQDSDTTLTVSNAIAGNGGLTKIGDGTLVLSSGANTYTGKTVINAGTLVIDSEGRLSNNPASFTIGQLTLDGGTLQTTDTFAIDDGNRGVTLKGGGGTFSQDSDTTLTVSNAIAGDGGLTKIGDGTLVLSGANTYTGDTKIGDGTLILANANALQESTLDHNGYGGSLSFGSLTSATFGGLKGNQNLALINGAAANVALTVGGNNASTTYSGVLRDGAGLTKTGNGSLTLSGANTYNGGTTLSTGRLNINNAQALGTGTFTISGKSTIDNTSGAAITLLPNNAQAWNADFTFAGSSDLDLGNGAVTLGGNHRVIVSFNTLTVGGAIGGDYSLTKAGTGGTLALGGANAYTGNTTISAGTLKLGSEASLASSMIDVAAGATFDVSEVSGGYNLTAGQTLNGAGAVSGGITISGIHAPGYSPGIQTIEGDYNMFGELQIELAGTDPGTGYDQVLLSGSGDYNATLDGTLTLDWTGFADSSEETQMWIVQNDTNGILSGEFDDYANGSWLGVHDDQGWWIWYGADAASGGLSGGNDVLISPVPEPSMLVLIGIAAIALSANVLRRRKLKSPITQNEGSRTMSHRYKAILVFCLPCLLLFGFVSRSQADYRYWTGDTGNWSNADNWGGTEPISGDYVHIYNGGTALVTTSGDERCYKLYLGDGSVLRSGTVQMTGGSLRVGGYEYVGYNGVGAFMQSGGTNTSGSLRVRIAGTYNLSDSGELRNNNASIAGTFTQTGGTHSSGVGALPSPSGHGLSITEGGTYSLSGSGLLTAHMLTINEGGTLRPSGGTLQLDSGSVVGYASLINNGTFDGANGSGAVTAAARSILDFSEGSLINTGSMSVSVEADSLVILPVGFDTVSGFGSYNNLGVTYTRGTTLVVPAGRSCTVRPYHTKLQINDPVNCQGTMAIVAWYSTHFEPGFYINNGLTISGTGSVSDCMSVTVNDEDSGMSGGSLGARYQYVGKSGLGTFTQTGGTNTLTNELWLGSDLGDTGTYSLSGPGQLSVAQAEYIGYNGSGTFTQSGGTNTVDDLHLGYESGSSGTYNLNGGTLSFESLSFGSGTAAFNFGGGTIKATRHMVLLLPMTLTGIGGNANVDTNGYMVSLVGQLSGPGGLNKLGTSILTLSNDYSYTGSTTIGAGTLRLISGASLASDAIDVADGATFDVSEVSGGYNLAAGKTLKGGGTVRGNVTISGVHAPGSSPGIQIIQGDYNMLGELQIELAGTAPGTGYDQVLLSGSGDYNATLDGTLTLDWTDFGDSSEETQMWIVQNDTNGILSGEFDDYANGSWLGVHDDQEWWIWYGADAASGGLSGGNDVLISPVPEPSMLVLIGIAAIALSANALRRRKLKLPIPQNEGSITMSHRYKTILVFCLPCLLLFGFVSRSQADYRYWTGGTGNWSVASNWGGTEPTATDYARIFNGGTALITQLGETANELYLGESSSGAVLMTGGSLSTTGAQCIGYNNIGIFTQSGGTNSGSVRLGSTIIGVGTYNLSDGELTQGVSVGYSGIGTFNQTGGTVCGAISVGSNSGSHGEYNLSAGQVMVSAVKVGYFGTGIFTQSGGTNTVFAGLGIGIRHNGTYNLDDGLLSVTSLDIGNMGTGTFNQSGGTNTVSNTLNLGFNRTSNGSDTYNLNSGDLSANFLSVGGNGVGTFTQSGGTSTISNGLRLATYSTSSSASSGTYNLNGGTFIVPSITKGSGTAAFNFGGGTLKASDNMDITLPITLTEIGGNANVNTNGYAVALPDQLSGPGGLNKLGDGTLTLSGNNSYAGATTIDAGTLLATTTAALPGYDTSGRVSVYDGGTLVVNYGGPGNWSAADVNTLINTASFYSGSLCGFDTTNAAGGAVYGNAINGILGVAKLGDNSLTLSGANTYTGKTVINAGTLVIDGEGRLGNNPASFTADQLTLDGGTLQTTATFAIDDGNRGVTLKGGGGTFGQDSDTALTVSNAIAGNGGLTKIGDGTLVLSGANNYAGKTVINAGTLVIDSVGRLGNNPASFTADQLTLDGGTLQTTDTFAIDDGNRGVTLKSGGGTFSQDSDTTLTVSNAIAGDGGLTKIGDGTLVFSGANTYTGDTKIGDGTFILANANALQNSTLDHNGYGGAFSFGSLTSATFGGLKGNQDLALINEDAVNVALTVGGNNASTTYSGVLRDGAGLTKTGNGSLTLSGANTYNGGTTLSAGRLNINNAQALGMGAFTISGNSTIDNTSGAAITLLPNNAQAWNADFTFAGSSDLDLGNGAVTLGGNRQVTVSANMLTVGGAIGGDYSLTKAGSGALTLSGANTYTGGTTLSAGRLNINNDQALGTGMLAISGTSTIGNTSGAAVTLANNNPQSWTADFTFAGGSDLDLGNGVVTLGGNRQVTVSANMLTVGGAIGGDYSLTKAGSGTLTLSGANTYTGGTTLSAGRLNIDNATALGTGEFTISGVSTIGNTSGAAVTLANNNPQSWNADFIFAGGSDLDLGNGVVTLGDHRQVAVYANTLTVGGAIGGNYSLTKAGSGALTLSGANTYTGGTTLSAGRLNINNDQALGTGMLAISGTGTIGNTSGAAVTLANNNPQSWTADFTFAGGSDLDLGNGVVTLGGNRLVAVSANTLTVGGVIGGDYSLTKAGTGTLALGGANAYTGNTTIGAGTLKLGSEASLASSMIGVAAGATFDVAAVSGGYNLTAGQTLNGAGAVSGDITINGIHAPGYSPGIQTIEGDYNMFGELQIELAGTVPGADYDQVLLSGSGDYNATLGGTLTLDWTDFGDSSEETQMWIVQNDTNGILSGEFDDYANGSWLGVHDDLEWLIWYGADAASGGLSGGNDVLISAVPEPSMLVLIGIAAIALSANALRRRKLKSPITQNEGSRTMSHRYKEILVFCLPCVLFFGFVPASQADDRDWVGDTGNWFDAANWWDGIRPTTGDYAYINNGGTACITLTDETCRNLYLGSSVSEAGTLDITGGSLISFLEYIGDQGSGTVTQSDGYHRPGYLLTLGYSANGVGNYTLSGGTLNIGIPGYQSGMANGRIGYDGTGHFTQSGGNHYIRDSLGLGCNQGSIGTYDLQDGFLSLGKFEIIGDGGYGSFTQSGGLNCAYLGILIGNNQGGSGTFEISGGRLWVGSFYSRIGGYGTGTFTQTGGLVEVDTSQFYLGHSPGSSGTYNLNGGTLVISSIMQGEGAATFNFGGGTLKASGALNTSLPMTLTGAGGNANVDTNGQAVTLAGQLSGSGGLNKLGAGTLTLSAANGYTGPTAINTGTLKLGSTASLASSTIDVGDGTTFDVSAVSGGYSLGAGQTLKGSGTVVGDVTIDGIHAPGNSPGIQTIEGDYNMLGELQIELAGTTAGTGYDQVLLCGTGDYDATLGGTLSLDWTDFADSTDETQLWIVENDTAGSLNSTFSNYANGSSLGEYDGRQWWLFYGADAEAGALTGGNDVLISAVPEPSTIALLGFAVIAVSGYALRRRCLSRFLRNHQ